MSESGRPFRDHAIVEAALAALRDTHHTAFVAIDCVSAEGVLHLRGHLPSFYLKQLAQERVKRIENIDRIVNGIVVTREGRSDDRRT